MRLHSLFRSVAALAAISSLTMLSSCFGSASGVQYSYQNITLSISPNVTSIPVNTSITFSATTSNAPNNPTWILLSYAYANLGSPPTSFGPTYVYTAPPTPPIYTGAGSINTQGTVTLQAGVFDDNFREITSSQTFVITAPSITTGITPATSTVSLNSTLQLNAYAVGSTNNALTLTVNGIPGGNASTGTLSTANQFPEHYLYTAPATMPITGSTVTITVTSQADPTKSASAVLTLQ